MECDRAKGGCGHTKDNFEHHEILRLMVKEKSNFQQSVQLLLDAPVNSDPMPEGYKCEIDPSKQCNKYDTCTKEPILYSTRDVLVISLNIFSYDEHGRARKFFPDLIIDKEITRIHHYKLKAIIWHHGQNLNSGHYAAMVKQRDQSWIHISDT